MCLSLLGSLCICPSGGGSVAVTFGGSVYLSLEQSVYLFLWGRSVSVPPGRLESVAMTYPKEVAQGHREPNGEGRGAHVVSTALVGGGEDAEHELQCQEKLHSNRLASCRVVAELGTEEGAH